MAWVPEILYEEAEDGVTSHIPFVQVPTDEEMPRLLYVFESRETDETEPGPGGEDLPITTMDLHQYADMATMKDRLDGPTFDRIRACFGLRPLADAAALGTQVSDRIRERMEADAAARVRLAAEGDEDDGST